MNTNFINNNTVINAEWLNPVDRAVFDAIGDGSVAPTDHATVKVNLSLDQVSNTTDLDKPISTATQTALNLKQDMLPTQTGNNGKYLQTNGTTPVWSVVDALPAQATHAGEFLTTNGTIASWVVVPASNSTSFGMFENAAIISSNYTITTGNNAISSGPVTITNGVTVVIPTGSSWSIV